MMRHITCPSPLILLSLVACTTRVVEPSKYRAFARKCLDAHSGECGAGGVCPGSNAPVVNTFPVNGLMGGESEGCNGEGMVLIPGSLTGGGCDGSASLTANNGQLIGSRQGATVCADTKLVNASFEVARGDTSLVFKIEAVKQVSIAGMSRTAYKITSAGKAACDPFAAVAMRATVGLGTIDPPRSDDPIPLGYESSDDRDYAIVVDAPVYRVSLDDRKAHRPSLHDSKLQGFFNLACVDDALASADSLRYKTDRLTVINMITASYCGVPMTVRGMNQTWQGPQESVTSRMTTLAHEARWGSEKALCLDTPRLYHLRAIDGGDVNADVLPARVQPVDCDMHSQAKPYGKCSYDAWVEGLRKDCGGLRACAGASAGAVDSWNGDGSARVTRKTP